MNYKKIEKIVNDIAYDYLNKSNLNDDKNSFFFISLVNESFKSLNFVSQQIINNEFFFNDFPFWWEKYYSKKEFIKLKKRAMNQFIYKLKEFNYA